MRSDAQSSWSISKTIRSKHQIDTPVQDAADLAAAARLLERQDNDHSAKAIISDSPIGAFSETSRLCDFAFPGWLGWGYWWRLVDAPEHSSTTLTSSELPISRQHGIYLTSPGCHHSFFLLSSQFKLIVTRSDSWYPRDRPFFSEYLQQTPIPNTYLQNLHHLSK